MPSGRRVKRSRGFAVAVVVVVLAASGCGPSDRPVSGPILLGPEWVEVVPPSPLQVSRDEQAVRLRLAGIADMDLHDGLKFEDGRRVVIEAEVVDDQGTAYPLALGGIAGSVHAYFYRAGEYPPGSDYPADRTIVTLRFRSDPEIEVEEIRWICSWSH